MYHLPDDLTPADVDVSGADIDDFNMSDPGIEGPGLSDGDWLSQSDDFDSVVAIAQDHDLDDLTAWASWESSDDLGSNPELGEALEEAVAAMDDPSDWIVGALQEFDPPSLSDVDSFVEAVMDRLQVE